MSDLSSAAKKDEPDFVEADLAVRPALQVLKKDGELCRRLLDQLDLSDPAYRPFAEGDFLFLPVLKIDDDRLQNQMKNIPKSIFRVQKLKLCLS